MSEEHRRWNCPTPPVAPHWYERSRAMLKEVDYVLSPSNYVTQSFLARGFKPEQIIRNIYPVNLDLFRPRTEPRPKDRPLTIINTGSLSLRKGTPYLLEAFRLVLKKHPTARLRLVRLISDNIRPILPRYADFPIDWLPPLNHQELAEQLRQADLFVLPSLEEGLVRTACEAMASGLPVILTPNTGANDFVQPGINGEIVPIRDAAATAEAILKWADLVLDDTSPSLNRLFNPEQFSFTFFQREFLTALADKKTIALSSPPTMDKPGTHP